MVPGADFAAQLGRGGCIFIAGGGDSDFEESADRITPTSGGTNIMQVGRCRIVCTMGIAPRERPRGNHPQPRKPYTLKNIFIRISALAFISQAILPQAVPQAGDASTTF